MPQMFNTATLITAKKVLKIFYEILRLGLGIQDIKFQKNLQKNFFEVFKIKRKFFVAVFKVFFAVINVAVLNICGIKCCGIKRCGIKCCGNKCCGRNR